MAQQPGTYTINLPNGGTLDVRANSPEEALAGAQSWYAQQSPDVLGSPIRPTTPPPRAGLATGLNDAWQSVVSGTAQLGQNLGGLDRAVFGSLYDSPLFAWERNMAEGAENLQERAEARQSEQRRWSQENNPWYSPDNLLHSGLTSIPSLIPTGVAAVGGGLVGGPIGAATAATAVEGAMGAGAVNDAVVDDLMARGFSEEEAVRAARVPSLGSGVVTGAIGRLLPTSRFADDLLAGRIAEGVASGAARGLISEGIEEGLQSSGEQIAQNIGVGSLVPEVGIMDNVAQAGMQGAVLGGLMGGTIGGTVGGLNNERARFQTGQQQLGEDALAEADAEARFEAIRAEQQAAQPQAPIAQPQDAPLPSLVDRSNEGLPTPGVPETAQRAVDEVAYRESIAPVLNEMMDGNYQALLQDGRDPAPTPPTPEQEITRDPFTPEMAAEVARASYAGPVSASMLSQRGVSNAAETLEILERRGHLRRVGEQKVELPGKPGSKKRSVTEPVYETTVPKPREAAGPGQETEITIKPIPSQSAPGTRSDKAPTPEAIRARTERALAAERDLREQLASIPQLPEDATQTQIDRRDQRVQALEERLKAAEEETARAQTGRADFAVVERIRDPQTGVVREQVVQAFPSRKEAEQYLGAARQGPAGEAVTSEQVVAAKAADKARRVSDAKKAQFQARARAQLGARLKDLGVADSVRLDVADRLVDAVAGPVKGYAEVSARDANGSPAEVVIAVGKEHYDPSLTEDQLLDKMAQTLNHEVIHAMRRMGLFTPAEWRTLTAQAKTMKMRGREYTYHEWAKENYGGLPGYDEDAIMEEAVAEMYKDWNANGRQLNQRYTGLLNKIASFFRALFRQMSEGDKIFQDVEEGRTGSRAKPQSVKDRAKIQRAEAAAQAARLEQPPVPAERRFSFAGTKARVMPMENYERATRMEKNRETKQRIYWETGFWRGKDGRWRFEIADADAKLRMDPMAISSQADFLSRFLDHPELFAAYPELDSVLVKSDNIPKGHGSNDWKAGLITISVNDTPEDARRILLHEIQHSIQKLEDFARGGSPEYISQSQQPYSVNHSLSHLFTSARRREFRKIRDTAIEEFNKVEVIADEDFVIPMMLWGYKNHIPVYGAGTRQDILENPANADAIWVFTDLAKGKRLNPDQMNFLDKNLSFAAYQALEGEIESRNVESRSLMNKRELLREAPWRTRDTDENLGIVVYYDARDLKNREEALRQSQDIQDDEGTPAYVPDEDVLVEDDDGMLQPRAFSVSRLGPAAQAALKRMGQQGLRPEAMTSREGAGADAAALRYTVLQDMMAKGFAGITKGGVEEARDRADKVTTFVQDRSFPLRRLVSNILKSNGLVNDANDPALWEDLYPRRSQHRLEASLTNLYRPARLAIQNVDGTKTDLQSLSRVSEAARFELESEHVSPSHALVNLFLYARHAKERNAFIREVRQAAEIDPATGERTGLTLDYGSGMTDAEADAIMNWFARYPKQGKVLNAASKIDAILDHTRRVRENAGLSPKWQKVKTGLEEKVTEIEEKIAELSINPLPEGAALLRQLNKELAAAKRASALVPDFKHYVPLRGKAMGTLVEDWETQEQHLATGKGRKIKGREDPRVKGRQSYAGDMFAHTVLQNQEAIVRSEKAAVGQSLLKLVRQNPELTKDVVEELGSVPMTRVVRDGKTILVPKMGVKESSDYFVTKENGEDVVLEVKNPALARFLNTTPADGGRGSHWLTKAIMQLGRLTRLMSRLVTSYSPEFLVPNFLRDWGTAVIQARQYDRQASLLIAKKAQRYAREGLLHTTGAIKNPEYEAKMERLSALGGLTGVQGLSTIETQIEEINREFGYTHPEDKNPLRDGAQKAIKTIAPIFNYLEAVNDAAEGATRLAVFEAFVERGWSEARAAQMAKNLTVNFNRKGEMGPIMNSLYMFFNASVQGSATLLQSMTHKEVAKIALGMMAAGALQETLMSAMSPEDEYGNKEYDKIEDYILERNAVIMLGDDGRYVNWPLPLGYNMFWNAGRLMSRLASGKDKPLETAGGILSSMLGAFNPIGGNSPISTAIFPSVTKPVAEAAQNIDFTGQAIHPEQMPGMDKAPSQSASPQASNMAQSIATTISRMTGGEGEYTRGAVEIYPDDIDHIVSQYLGGLGRTIGRFNNLMGYVTDPQGKAIEGREIRARDIPFYRSFAGNVSGSSVRSTYNDVITPYLEVGKNYDAYERVGNYEALDALVARDEERLMIYDVVKDYEGDRIKIRREIREIQEDTQIPDSQKISIINALREEEQLLMNELIRDVRGLEREMGLR